jgi:hypothetical protein
MDNSQFIPSILQTKSCASLEAEVAKELNIKDPKKSIAQLLKENNEEETNSDEEENDQNPQEDKSIRD